MPTKTADALRFIEENGIVLESARGKRPNLAEWIVQENIRGSWWGHPRSHEIFAVLRSVRRSPDVLVCRLIQDKITFVHRRLWPALARLSESLKPGRLAIVDEVHTREGHRVRSTPFREWVGRDILAEAETMTEADALRALGDF